MCIIGKEEEEECVLNESWLLQQPTLIPPSGERNAKCWRHLVIMNMKFLYKLSHS